MLNKMISLCFIPSYLLQPRLYDILLMGLSGGSLPSSGQHLPAFATAPVLKIFIIITHFPCWKVASQCLLNSSQILVSPWKFSVPWLLFPFTCVFHRQQHMDTCCVPRMVDVVWARPHPCIHAAHVTSCSHYPELTAPREHLAHLPH